MADQTLYIDGVNNSGNKQFVSLDAAMDYAVANWPDLTTLAGKINFEISITTEDTLAATTTGFSNATSSYYLNIYTTAAARHAGVWSNSKYRLTRSTTYSTPLTIVTPYTRVTGLQVLSSNATTNGNKALIVASGAVGSVIIDSCIMRCNSTGTAADASVVIVSASNTTAYLRNCIIYGSTAGPGGIYTGTLGILYAQNCTIYVPNAVAAAYRASGSIYLDSCYLGGPTDTIYSATSETNCATSDDDASDANLRSIAASTSSGAYFTNVDSGTEDFTIKSDSLLIGEGSDMSGTYTYDIKGSTRTLPYDIGAFEYLSTAQYARPNSDVADGNWLNQASSNVNLYASIDEETANDTDYIRSGSSPSDDTCTVGLSSISTPAAGTVTMRVRARFL